MAFVQPLRNFFFEPLPPLNVGPYHTQISAIHPISFVGKLGLWDHFEAIVRDTFDSTKWDDTAQLPILGVSPLAHEYYHVGEERGVQSRFTERISQALTHVAVAQQLDFRFGDAKCVLPTYAKSPDFMIWNPSSNTHLVVGELKTPWIREHQLGELVMTAMNGGSEWGLRRNLGQIAMYMCDLGLKYGVLSTYDETVFLRQVVERRKWKLEVSPVIQGSHGLEDPNVTTLRMCFFHMASLSLIDRHFEMGGLRAQQWTESLC
ncbi:hypothetical protein PDE_00386 [Penicillium oxalicum 114-2]|uniref:Uncharacterized protein n=1 Tax=Penicillium oxalicum (strain 114-2 / CGMCC 5302) TaxID=933388 RepID=S8AI99_PENO1|nr:hypothetical protein PDE_00386 [Penicillium oxalicum 114-2]